MPLVESYLLYNDEFVIQFFALLERSLSLSLSPFSSISCYNFLLIRFVFHFFEATKKKMEEGSKNKIKLLLIVVGMAMLLQSPSSWLRMMMMFSFYLNFLKILSIKSFTKYTHTFRLLKYYIYSCMYSFFVGSMQRVIYPFLFAELKPQADIMLILNK